MSPQLALRRICAPAAALASAAVLALTASGAPKPPATIPVDGRSGHVGRITWHGGDVQHHPRIYTIFWRDGKRGAYVSRGVNAMVSALGGSAWARALAQYYDGAGHVTADIRQAGTWTDPTHFARSENMAHEVTRAVVANGWQVTPDTQFVLVLPPNTMPFTDGGITDAYHTYNDDYVWSVVHGIYTGMDQKSALTFVTTDVSHEIAEAITDPHVQSWTGSGAEVADPCQGRAATTLVTPSGKRFALAPFFNDRRNRCLS